MSVLYLLSLVLTVIVILSATPGHWGQQHQQHQQHPGQQHWYLPTQRQSITGGRELKQQFDNTFNSSSSEFLYHQILCHYTLEWSERRINYTKIYIRQNTFFDVWHRDSGHNIRGFGFIRCFMMLVCVFTTSILAPAQHSLWPGMRGLKPGDY